MPLVCDCFGVYNRAPTLRIPGMRKIRYQRNRLPAHAFPANSHKMRDNGTMPVMNDEVPDEGDFDAGRRRGEFDVRKGE